MCRRRVPLHAAADLPRRRPVVPLPRPPAPAAPSPLPALVLHHRPRHRLRDGPPLRGRESARRVECARRSRTGPPPGRVRDRRQRAGDRGRARRRRPRPARLEGRRRVAVRDHGREHLLDVEVDWLYRALPAAVRHERYSTTAVTTEASPATTLQPSRCRRPSQPRSSSTSWSTHWTRPSPASPPPCR